jgi:hypothetical protein
MLKQMELIHKVYCAGVFVPVSILYKAINPGIVTYCELRRIHEKNRFSKKMPIIMFKAFSFESLKEIESYQQQSLLLQKTFIRLYNNKAYLGFREKDVQLHTSIIDHFTTFMLVKFSNEIFEYLKENPNPSDSDIDAAIRSLISGYTKKGEEDKGTELPSTGSVSAS